MDTVCLISFLRCYQQTWSMQVFKKLQSSSFQERDAFPEFADEPLQWYLCEGRSRDLDKNAH